MVEFFLSICIKLDPFSFSIDIDAIGNVGEPLLHIYLISTPILKLAMVKS